MTFPLWPMRTTPPGISSFATPSCMIESIAARLDRVSTVWVETGPGCCAISSFCCVRGNRSERQSSLRQRRIGFEDFCILALNRFAHIAFCLAQASRRFAFACIGLQHHKRERHTHAGLLERLLSEPAIDLRQ